MAIVRISRIDGARVEDKTLAALRPRLSGDVSPQRDNGSLLIPFPSYAPREAVRAVVRMLDDRLAGWRSEMALSL